MNVFAEAEAALNDTGTGKDGAGTGKDGAGTGKTAADGAGTGKTAADGAGTGKTALWSFCASNERCTLSSSLYFKWSKRCAKGACQSQ